MSSPLQPPGTRMPPDSPPTTGPSGVTATTALPAHIAESQSGISPAGSSYRVTRPVPRSTTARWSPADRQESSSPTPPSRAWTDPSCVFTGIWTSWSGATESPEASSG